MTAEPATESLPIAEAAGRVLAADLLATQPIPAFASSAMDGWAVRGDGPWSLGAPIAAGDRPTTEPLEPGTARPISTGAPVPPDADRVLRSERGEIDDGGLKALATDGGNIRPAGEEAAAGALLLPAGTRLSPAAIALAAVAGRDDVEVLVRPTVDLVVLGNEVIDAGEPPTGLVRDAYTPALPAALARLGLAHERSTRVGDSLDLTIAALRESTADLVITTGGTAHGTADHLHEALAILDAHLIIDGVRMRPGHPVLLARLPFGTLVLGLPGNPFAAYVALSTLGAALADGMLHREIAPLATSRLAVDVPWTGSSTRVAAARTGATGLTPTDHQGAGMLRGLAAADCLCVVPPGGALAGDRVETIAVPW
jgi:molybdopterin molybdotransferase